MSIRRIAFYPCCGNDIAAPYRILLGTIDEIIYCDISPDLADDPSLANAPPSRIFWQQDVVEAIERISHIDLLFYRRDGIGEGGSGQFVLGERIFPLILKKMMRDECRILTDGSNSRGGRFRKMNRASGLLEAGKIITRSTNQPLEAFGVSEFLVRNHSI